MFRLSIGAAGIRAAQADLAGRRAALASAYVLIAYACCLRAAGRVADATPVSAVVRERDGTAHVHMRDRWDARPTPAGAALGNPAPYAWFVADGTRFMDANPQLAEAIRTLHQFALADAAELLGGTP